MAIIAKFKALRPIRDKVHLVATRPYYSYKKNVLKAKLESNPFTFLHIINPEFGHQTKTKPNSEERFSLVKEGYKKFKDQGILVQDKEAHIYLYKQTSTNHSCIGVIAGASVQEYLDKKIKIHEATLTSRETIFEKYLDVVGYNAEPVLLSYKGNESLENYLRKIQSERPEYEFTTTDNVKHELWIVEHEASKDLQNYFKSIDEVYIADGHHRSASSAGLYQKKGNLYTNSKNFLAYFVEENQLNIIAFNRLVKTLNNLSPEVFIEKLQSLGELTILKYGIAPDANHTMHFCIDKQWYRLKLNTALIDENHPVKSLDADLLTELILKPILNIEDLKTSDAVDFLPGTFNAQEFEKEMKKNNFHLGFMLYPVNIHQIKAVADAGLYMPPKSTWVEPKLRSGLTIYNLK
jgi:uncharacterized protein (DUF1015 family)